MGKTGIDKRRLHHYWRKIHAVNHWHFFLLSIVFLVIGVYCMRQNNLAAIRLRDKVVAADKANKDVETPLRELRQYVYSHMNTDLSSGTGVQHPIQLKYRYDRLVAAEKARVNAASGDIYTKAQKVCEAKFPAGFSGSGRIPCIEEYVSNSGVKPNAIPDDLYKFNFVSPRWAPDWAGVSLLLSVIFFMLFILRFIMEHWMKYELQQYE